MRRDLVVEQLATPMWNFDPPSTLKGGVFTEGPWRPWDFVEPYLREILGFIGVVDVQAVRVEGINIPVLAATAVLKANRAVGELVL